MTNRCGCWTTITITCVAISRRRERRWHQWAISAKLFVSDIDKSALDRWVRGEDDGDVEEAVRNPSNKAARTKLFVLEFAQFGSFCADAAKYAHSFMSSTAALTISSLSTV